MDNPKLVPPSIKTSQMPLFSTLTGPGESPTVTSETSGAMAYPTTLSQGQDYAGAVFQQITNEFTLNDLVDFKTEFTRLLNAKVKNLLS